MDIHEYEEAQELYERELKKFKNNLYSVGSFLESGIGDFNQHFDDYPTREIFGDLFETRNALKAKKADLKERREKWNL